MKNAKEEFTFLKDISLEDFYREINLVEPSLIRVDADELTYSLHIMVRYEIEKRHNRWKYRCRGFTKSLEEKMEEYLGVVPSTDSEGVMQDVHWSAGLVGYFHLMLWVVLTQLKYIIL